MDVSSGINRFLLRMNNCDFEWNDIDNNGIFRLDVILVPLDGNNIYSSNFDINCLEIERIYSIDFELSSDNPIESFADIYSKIIEDFGKYEYVGNGYIVDKEYGIVYFDNITFSVSRI
jgi:hypothetical protein